jgi:uracil-DNA glycosylase family 4
LPAQEYLEAVLDALKKIVPKETFDQIHALALPVSGGRAKANRVKQQRQIEKIEIGNMTPEKLKEMSDDEISLVWSQLNQGFNDAKEKGLDIEDFVNFGKLVMDEIMNREIEHDMESELSRSISILEESAEISKQNSGELTGEAHPPTESDIGEIPINVIHIDICGEPFMEEQTANVSDQEKNVQKDLKNIIPSAGNPNCEIAFVGASPGRIEKLRREPLVGPSGETFNDQYLAPLGLSRKEVFITNAVPTLLLDQKGNVREPTSEEIDTWHEWLMGELERANPKVIVALGKIARKALDGEADFIVPHPMAIRRFGDSGEVGRKIKQIRTKLDEINKGLPGLGDVHIPTTNWRRLKKADANIWDNPGKEPIPIKISGSEESGIYADIIKADNDKHLVYGVVLEPGSVDAQNDTIGPEEIERAAHVYLQDSRIIGNSHKAKARATVVESYIAPIDFTLGGQKVTKGTWIMTVKINDDKLWQEVKDGKFNGFSIGGFSRRIPVDKPAS